MICAQRLDVPLFGDLSSYFIALYKIISLVYFQSFLGMLKTIRKVCDTYLLVDFYEKKYTECAFYFLNNPAKAPCFGY